jgi:hypothetical protein
MRKALAAAAVAAVLALPAAASWGPKVAAYVDLHLNVPYIRDCHGLFAHQAECETPPLHSTRGY